MDSFLQWASTLTPGQLLAISIALPLLGSVVIALICDWTYRRRHP